LASFSNEVRRFEARIGIRTGFNEYSASHIAACRDSRDRAAVDGLVQHTQLKVRRYPPVRYNKTGE
jgi:hypothetical protein